MTTSYPGAVDNLTNPTPSDTLNSATVPHAAQHANINDAMEAVQNTLGTNPQGTAASVKARLDTLEGVIDDRLPGEANSIQPTGPFPTGYVWVDASANAIKVWNGTTFVDPSNAGGGTGLPWAVVSGGNVNEYTHPTYGVMQVHTFAANGTLVVATEGLADVLLVGAGGGASAPYSGNGGDVLRGLHQLPTGSQAVVVGAGGVDGFAAGGASSVGALVTAIATWAPSDARSVGGAGTVALPKTGYTSSITGTDQEYAKAGQSSPRTNFGDGRVSPDNTPGASGVVIVAVKKP